VSISSQESSPGFAAAVVIIVEGCVRYCHDGFFS
jgi:hypothetical protein